MEALVKKRGGDLNKAKKIFLVNSHILHNDIYSVMNSFSIA